MRNASFASLCFLTLLASFVLLNFLPLHFLLSDGENPRELDATDVIRFKTILKKLQTQIDQLDSNLIERYGAENFFIFSKIFKFYDSDHLLREKLLHSLLVKHAFNIDFTGTSVTVGRKAGLHSRFSGTLQRELGPIFDTAGIHLSTSNFAIGSNQILPYSMCLSSITRADADIVAWEQRYMCNRRHLYCFKGLEMFVRGLLRRPSQPLLLVLQPDARMTENDLTRVADSIFTDTSGQLDIREYYRHYGIHSMLFADVLAPVFSSNGSKGLFTKENLHLWEHDGILEVDTTHPGKHGHELAGLCLAKGYAMVLQDVVQNLVQRIDMGPRVSIPALRSPAANLRYPNSDNHCAVAFEPNADASSEISQFISSENVVDLRPAVTNVSLEMLAGNTEVAKTYEGKWVLEMFLTAFAAVTASLAKGGDEQYEDRKWSLAGCVRSGNLTFRLPSPRVVTDITVCRPNKASLPRYFANFKKHAKWYVNDREVTIDPVALNGYNEPCGYIEIDRVSNVRLTVEPTAEEKFVFISHIVWN